MPVKIREFPPLIRVKARLQVSEIWSGEAMKAPAQEYFDVCRPNGTSLPGFSSWIRKLDSQAGFSSHGWQSQDKLVAHIRRIRGVSYRPLYGSSNFTRRSRLIC